MPRLAVGTVQFGTAYGVSNSTGQTSTAELTRIVEFLAREQIDLYDTAPLYGESEKVLGDCLPDASAEIVTKTTHFHADQLTAQDARSLQQTFEQSLQRLRRSRLYALMVHQADDLLKPGAEYLWQALESLKAQGLITKIGVSVYNASQLDPIVQRFAPDLVQLPLNLLDQRLFRTGHLHRLHEQGVEIHTRSAFLQGLLLMPATDRPAWFQPYRDALQRFDRFVAARAVTPLQAALGFVMALPCVDRVVVGACSLAQWQTIVAASRLPFDSGGCEALAVTDAGLLEPSRWQL